MDSKLTKIYYSPKGYWKGMAAIKKLANAAKVSEDEAKRWLTKQALWQVYLPGPHYIPRPKFDISTPNAVHQADLLFLPHDKLPRGKKVYKYALTVWMWPAGTKRPRRSHRRRATKSQKALPRYTDTARLSGHRCCKSIRDASSWEL